MDRLRANLRAAGIPVTGQDIERLEADGYIERVVDTREILAAADAGGEPDFLGEWDEGRRAVASTAGDPGVLSRSSGRGGAPSPPGDLGVPLPTGDPGVPSPTGDPGVPLPSRGSQASLQKGGIGAEDGYPGTIAGVAELIRAGAISPVELTERALGHIAARDRELNLFQVVLDERALDAARRAEQELARGNYRGPLHGVPIAAKDLLEMRGTITTAGSKLRADAESRADAAAIERLEAAGAIIVGKTRLSEFAYWPGSTNPHYGATRNPHDLEHDAGGSSSGSAAAVASGCVYAALGTDTGGSIRIPAALCGVVGHKPTFGRVSLFGCVPLAWSLDHLGPLTRSAEDAALVLEALAGHDGRDLRTRANSHFEAAEVRPEPRGATGATGRDLAGLRVGVMAADGSGHGLGSMESIAAWQASNRILADQGAVLEEVDLSEMHVLWRVAALILGVEASAYHADNLRRDYDAYGRFCRGRLVGAFAYGSDDMLRAHRVRWTVRQRWNDLWNDVDVISTPCQPDVAPALGVAASTRFTNPFNALGWPASSLPFGRGKGGLPLGTQIAGPAWGDAQVLRVATALSAAE